MINKVRKLRVDYISDIHLEKRSGLPLFNFKRRASCDLLVLAGDIGHPNKPLYREFLAYASNNWNNVALIAGNHEYQCLSARPKDKVENEARVNDMISKTCAQFINVHFLNCSAEKINGVHVLGCTFWHTFPGMHKMCHVSGAHYLHYCWLYKEVARIRARNERALVITHHLPSYRLIEPRFSHYKAKHLWASNSDRLIGPPVAGWIYGHSHSRSRAVINDVPICINAQHRRNRAKLALDTLEI